MRGERCQACHVRISPFDVRPNWDRNESLGNVLSTIHELLPQINGKLSLCCGRSVMVHAFEPLANQILNIKIYLVNKLMDGAAQYTLFPISGQRCSPFRSDWKRSLFFREQKKKALTSYNIWRLQRQCVSTLPINRNKYNLSAPIKEYHRWSAKV